MDIRIENSAGFAVPTNVRRTDPVHWWTTKDKKACAPEDEVLNSLFVGERFGQDQSKERQEKKIFEERGVCLPCLLEVLKAAEILGLPTGFPLDLKVKIR